MLVRSRPDRRLLLSEPLLLQGFPRSISLVFELIQALLGALIVRDPFIPLGAGGTRCPVFRISFRFYQFSLLRVPVGIKLSERIISGLLVFLFCAKAQRKGRGGFRCGPRSRMLWR